jgi:hypothetical protein
MAKKQQIKVTPLRSGRRVRWTFEVSADVDAENRTRAKKSAKKRTHRRSIAKQASPPPLPHPGAVNDSAVGAMQAAVEPTPIVVTAPVMESTPPWQPTRGQLAALGGVAVLVIATVALPQQPPASDAAPPQQQVEQRERAADLANPLPTAPTPAPPARLIAARSVVTERALTEAPKKSSVVTNRATAPTKPTPPASIAANNDVPLAKESTKPAVPEPMTAAPPSSASAASLAPVTITGCLEISTDGNEFRLADTEGADAPKSRNWRMGFLKKRTAPVALVGAADPLALRKSVGQRVAATGLLTGRELQVSSLRVLGSSCN